jgi:malate dehydrogenase (oxaloacetate-decarboxylating)(NADP+)
MAPKPLILALANPEPEIMPDVAKEARPDAVIATGRSDFPNQVNNVLCFPFIFRGALDVGATTVNEAMKLATVKAIADLAMAEQSDIVANAYGDQDLRFGPEYLIPRPFDPRLIVMIAPAVAKAAMDSGVATRPITDFPAYRERLLQFVYTSSLLMKPIFAGAKKDPKRIVFAEGEDERVLRAIQIVIDEGLAQPIVVARPFGAPAADREAGPAHPSGAGLQGRESRSPIRGTARTGPSTTTSRPQGGLAAVREDRDAAAPDADRRMMIHMGEADGMLCGTFGTHALHLDYVRQVIGLRKGSPRAPR